jgi:hypothetical protein
MTEKLPRGGARQVIIEMQGSGKKASQIAKMLDISESYVWRMWREAKQPVVLHLGRLRHKYGQGTGTMRTVMGLLTEAQRDAIFKDASDLNISVPGIIVLSLRDAYPPAETEEKP